MPAVRRPVLTLRFKRPRTHSRLRSVSKLIGSSMNDIAETAIERELDFLATDLEEELLETVQALRSWEYTDSALKSDIAAFAEGEAYERDPLRTSLISTVDSAGVGEIFADPVER